MKIYFQKLISGALAVLLVFGWSFMPTLDFLRFEFFGRGYSLQPGSNDARASVSVPFSTTGTTTWVVPNGVYSISMKVWGAGGGQGEVGGNNNADGGGGGGGGFAGGTISVTPGETLEIIVGTGGGGGNNTTVNDAGGGGGGFSGVYRKSNNTFLIIAGGGGGGGSGGNGSGEIGGGGGGGGGADGGNGALGADGGCTSDATAARAGDGGDGATTAAAGAGGSGCSSGANGSQGNGTVGGSGASSSANGGAAGTPSGGRGGIGGSGNGGGGAGGGGKFGGGGGEIGNSEGGGGGGGGSGYTVGLTNVTTAQGTAGSGLTAGPAANNTDPDYSAGVGDGGGGNKSTGAAGDNGGNGRVVIVHSNLIEISGKLYDGEGTGADSIVGKTIKLFVGTSSPGVYSTTTTRSDGGWGFAFTINGFANATGAPIIAWLDNGLSQKAVAITKASSTNEGASITNLDLYKNTVIVRHEGHTGTSTTIADFAAYDNDNDSDLPYNANNNHLQINASNTLYIWPGTEFRPNGNITLHANAKGNGDGTLKLAAGAAVNGRASSSILSLNGNSLSVGGSFYASSSSIFYTTGTTTFTGTSTTRNIYATSTNFYHVNFNSASSSGTYVFQNGATTTGNFGITSGNVIAPSTALNIQGNYFNTGGRFQQPIGTTTFSGTTTQMLSGFMVGSSTFNNVVMNGTGQKIFANNASTTNLTLISQLATTTGSNTVLDFSGNQKHGSAQNGAIRDDGKIGQAMQFDGADDMVSVGDPSDGSLDFGVGQDFTISVWIYPNDLTSSKEIVRKADTVSTPQFSGYFFRTNGTNLQLTLTDATPTEYSISGSTTIQTGQWTHVAAHRNGKILRLFVNGVQDGSDVQATSSSIETSAQFLIGKFFDDNNETWNGLIDDVRIYRRALPLTEINQLYMLPQIYSTSTEALAAWWPMDEPATTTAPSLLSISGNYANHASLLDSNNGTVYIASTTAQQTFSGNMTGLSSFNSVNVLNNSGSNGTTSPSVIFKNSASTTGTFTATVANTKIQFPASATTSINNLTANGQAAGTKVTIRPYEPGKENLISWYRLDEGSGSTYKDSAGANHVSTVEGSPSWTTGKIGSGVRFDGQTDRLLVLNHAANVSTAATFAVWVKPDALATFGSDTFRQFLVKNYILRIDETNIPHTFNAFINIGGDYEPRVTTSTILETGKWYHLVATYDGASLKGFVNGRKEGQVARTGSISDSTGTLLINDAGSVFFEGTTDDVRIYNRALSEAEVAELYAITSPQFGVNVTDTGTFSYTDFMDTNACAGGTNLQATDGTNTNSGNNNCIDFSASATLTQRNFGWASNTNNLNTGGLVSAVNATGTSATGTVHRLRMDVTASGAAISAQTFTLQYKTLGSGCGSGSYTTLGAINSASIWRGYNNTGVADGTSLSNWVLDPSNIPQSYEEDGSSSSNPQTIGVGSAGEWDWVIQNNGAPEGTYCFKMVKTSGLTNLNNYTRYAVITVEHNNRAGGGGGSSNGQTIASGGENAPASGVTGGGTGRGGGSSDVPPPPPGGTGGGGGQGGGGGGGIDYIPFYKLYAHLFKNVIVGGLNNLSGIVLGSWMK